jgi:GntR family transcriptional regulator, transcriptional repressor for pyruvate dehydrogenase complex
MEVHRFKPIKQLRISDEVAEQLKQSIVLEHFRAGDRLPSERDLAEEFRVSRVAVREALRSLEISGFIETRQGASGGAYVTDLTFEHLVSAFLDLFTADKISIPELYQVRVLVEPEVARLAALNLTPGYVERLKETLEREDLPETTLADDLDRKTALHFILAEMCGNRFFEALVRSVMGLTRRAIEAAEPETWTMHPAGMHRPIVGAVISGDPEAAAAEARKHAIEFGENLVRMEKAYRERKSQSLL